MKLPTLLSRAAVFLAALVALSAFVGESAAAAAPRLKWKTKPNGTLVAHENEPVTLHCEFEQVAAATSDAAATPTMSIKDNKDNYFVIWYKEDDTSSNNNVISLNDQLSSKTNSSYHINGTYNLVIQNVTRNHAGVYTCQLFQSDDMIASVNLTVLGKPFIYYTNATKDHYLLFLFSRVCLALAGMIN